MNKNIQRLVERAGFAFWAHEEWGPGPGHICWAGEYDKEFDKFIRFFTRECAAVIKESGLANEYTLDELGKRIKKHFK